MGYRVLDFPDAGLTGRNEKGAEEYIMYAVIETLLKNC